MSTPETLRLARQFAGVAKAALPAGDADRAKRVERALGAEGTVRADALPAWPEQTVDWYVAGTLTVATNAGLEWRVPRSLVLLRLDIRVKTAPVGSWVDAQIAVNGSGKYTATIAAGATTGTVAPLAPYALNPGDVLTLNVNHVGSTTAGANLSAQAVVRPV